MKLSEKITLLRKRKGMSQEQLAGELDVSRQAIYKWETGITTPEIEKAKRLTEIFCVSLDDLLNDNVDISEAPIIVTNSDEEASAPPSSDEMNIPSGEAKIKSKKNIALFSILSCFTVIFLIASIVFAIIAFRDNNDTEHIHSFGGYKIELSPSCDVAGIERRFCQCGESESRPIATIPHQEIAVSGYPATCSYAGLSNGKKCVSCNTILQEQSPLPIVESNHIEVIISGTPATCKQTGLTDGIKCSLCDTLLTKQEVIPVNAENHTRVAIKGKPSTCIEKGLTEGVKCSECNAVLQGQNELPLSGHTEEIVKGYNVTCLKDGLTDGKRCSYCKSTLVGQTVIISNGQHVRETIKGYASTCDVQGLSDGIKCSECGEILTEQESLPLAPHTEATVTGYESASCITTGLSDSTSCSVCGVVLVEAEILPAKSHCFEDGVCTDCGNLEGNYGASELTFALNEDKKSYTVSCYQGSLTTITNLVVPSTYNGIPVTHIGSFDEIYATSVHLPNTVTHINDSAFLWEEHIEKINIPNSVISIGHGAFEGCSSLSILYIPNSVTIMESYIADAGPVDFGSMSNLVIYCQNGADTTNWDDNWSSFWLQNCTSRYSDDAIYIHHDVRYVDSIDDIPTAELLEGSELIFYLNNDGHSYAVCCNDRLQTASSIIIPETHNDLPVTAILDQGFEAHPNLESVYIPFTVQTIGEKAFYQCSKLKNVTISSGVSCIKSEAFSQTAIEEIYIPSSVVIMYPIVFDNCPNLQIIYCQHQSQPDDNGLESSHSWHFMWNLNSSISLTEPVKYTVEWNVSEDPTV